MLFFFSEMESRSVSQVGVQWRDLSSLQPLPPGFNRLSHVRLLTSGDYRPVPPHSANLVEMEFHHVGQAGLELLTSSDHPSLWLTSASSALQDDKLRRHSHVTSCICWSAVSRSRLTATSASQVQAIFLPQPPK
uniref:Uncharacterized protein n=1 Tax=Papio anubis TaxID=9555 RepID=A0A8I5NR57_PAPAN